MKSATAKWKGIWIAIHSIWAEPELYCTVFADGKSNNKKQYRRKHKNMQISIKIKYLCKRGFSFLRERNKNKKWI